MQIGIPRELKDQEFRVGMVPDGARVLVAGGHPVLVERGAGQGSGFADEEYAAAGARLVDAAELWGESELVVKVKEPQPAELARMRPEEGRALLERLAKHPRPAVREAVAEARQNLDALASERDVTDRGAYRR